MLDPLTGVRRLREWPPLEQVFGLKRRSLRICWDRPCWEPQSPRPTPSRRGKANQVTMSIYSKVSQFYSNLFKERVNKKKYPYIAKDRTFVSEKFDFWIANEVGEEWYDASPNQFMFERGWCKDHIQPGMTIVDCGAHHGMMTVLFGRWTGPAGVVYAFEALPTNASVIEMNLNLNHLNNAHVRGVALGDKRCRIPVEISGGNARVGIHSSTGDFIECARLDDELAGIKVDFIKIDVEGYEVPALRGMKKTLRMRPIIDLELHCFAYEDRLGTLQKIFEMVPATNWIFYVQPTIDQPIARTEELDLRWLSQFDNPHVFGTPRPQNAVRHIWENAWTRFVRPRGRGETPLDNHAG
jgi:FkbM family methyltransferase